MSRPDHEHQVWNAVRCAHDTSQDQRNHQNMRCAKAGHEREGSVGKKHWKTDSGSKSTFWYKAKIWAKSSCICPNQLLRLKLYGVLGVSRLFGRSLWSPDATENMFISSPLSFWWLLLLHNVLSHKIQALHSTTVVQAVLILYYFVMWAMRAMLIGWLTNCETGIWGCSRVTDNGNKSNVNSHQSWSQIQLDLENPSLRQEKSLSDVGWPWRLSLKFIAHHSYHHSIFSKIGSALVLSQSD